MLKLKVAGGEIFDEETQTFQTIKGTTLQLEHSLVSVSKWEQKWHKPFLGRDGKTSEEVLDYVRCMTITQNVDPLVYYVLGDKNMELISNYIADPATATTINNPKKSPSREIVTSELIYYWMLSFNIPIECQKWHLNRLLTLVEICSIKNKPAEKMSTKSVLSQNRSLNASRRARHHSRG